MIWLKNYQNNIYTTSSLAATSLCFKGGGCWSKFRGIFFLMNFELLTFPCREMITSARHTWVLIIQAASVLRLVCLPLKVNNGHLNFPPKSDHGCITHHRPLCTINSCTDLVSVRMHLDKLRHSHLAPSHTKANSFYAICINHSLWRGVIQPRPS